MDIRSARHGDLPGILELYTQLHGNALPDSDDRLAALWQRILADPGHHILVGVEEGDIVSSCVLVIIPNLTHGQRPYALLENVVTHSAWRKRGFAAQLLAKARDIAKAECCYKIMLLTGAKDDATLRFYEQAGFNSHDKTAFIQWLW